MTTGTLIETEYRGHQVTKTDGSEMCSVSKDGKLLRLFINGIEARRWVDQRVTAMDEQLGQSK